MPDARSSLATRASYQASSAGLSEATTTAASGPSQSASQVFMPAGDTCRHAPLATSRSHAVRHSSSPPVVSTVGAQAGRAPASDPSSAAACAASSPTLPDPSPSATSACSPAMTSSSVEASGDGRWSSGNPGGDASRRGSPTGPSGPTSSRNGAGRWREPMSARNVSTVPPRDQRGSFASTPAPVTCQRREPSTERRWSSVWPRPSSPSTSSVITATSDPSGDTSGCPIDSIPPTARSMSPR